MVGRDVEVIEVERQETVSKLNTRIRDLETALNNAAEHAKGQAARIKVLEAVFNSTATAAKGEITFTVQQAFNHQAAQFRSKVAALEADVSSARDSLNAALESRSMMEAERDALRAEVARLKDPDTLRNINARDNITRIKNLQAALDEALGCCGCFDMERNAERIRAIADGKTPCP